MGTCRPMPSLRQISTSRMAQDAKAPSAQSVMICQSPPSASGARARPREMAGGAMQICSGFQVGPSAAPHRIRPVPSTEQKIVVTPKKPT